MGMMGLMSGTYPATQLLAGGIYRLYILVLPTFIAKYSKWLSKLGQGIGSKRMSTWIRKQRPPPRSLPRSLRRRL